uniref:Nucleobindin 1 n=1 Tax=Astyanax mexicanus TaxID=7994 RepID=A0A8B9HJ46_ASTMX
MVGAWRWLLLLSISLRVWSVPIDRKTDGQDAPPPQEEKAEENMLTNEVPVWVGLAVRKRKRERDIRAGRYGKKSYHDIVFHIRCAIMFNNPSFSFHILILFVGVQMDHVSLLKQFEHLDPHNQNTFEAKDLELLIAAATKDLENYDAERHEEFKRYEMLKEHERREYLKSLDQEKREREEKRIEDLREKHRQHPKVNAPVSKRPVPKWSQADGTSLNILFSVSSLLAMITQLRNFCLISPQIFSVCLQSADLVLGNSRENLVGCCMVVERQKEKVDLNRDRLVSLEEFIKSTEKKEFNNAKEWETLDDKQPVYTEAELQRFEAELRDKEVELSRRAETLRQEQELLKERGKALEAQKKEYQQALMEMSQRQKDQQAVNKPPPSGPNGDLQFQQEIQKLAQGDIPGEDTMNSLLTYFRQSVQNVP